MRAGSRQPRVVRAVWLGLLSICLVLLTAACGRSAVTIGVFQYGPDPDTRAAYEGLVAGLRDGGYIEGEDLRIEFRDCGRDDATIQRTARRFAGAGLDAVVPLTTPCLVAAAARITDTPVVFTSVYDPMAAGVATSPDEHPPNLTGVYSTPPVEQTIRLIAECLPGVSVIGTIWNPGEANAAAAVARMRAYCSAHEVVLEEAEVTASADVGEAVSGLLAARPGDGGSAGGRSPGALYITGDNTVMAAFADVLAAAGEHRVPVFINDPGFVEQGAVAGLGPDFRKAGVAGGRLLAEVLDGRRPGALPLRRCSATQLYVNPAAAAALGVRLPAAVLDRAAAVVGPTP